MKVLLIHSEGENPLVDKLKALFAKTGIQLENYLVVPNEEERRKTKKQFTTFFFPPTFEAGFPVTTPHRIRPTHVLILSALSSGWVDFLAGLSCGSCIPFLVYGKEAAKNIPVVFTFCFKILNTKDELQDYLKNEYEIYKRIDADRGVNEAREALLKMGIPVNEKSMVLCVEEGGLREVLFFLAAGFSPDTRSQAGIPLLNIAARNGNREIIRYLFLAGAQLNSQANDRNTSPLIDSVIGKHPELMMDLINAGADLEIKSKDGQTALTVATGNGDMVMVEALLKAGADPNIPDNLGMSARKYAALFHKNTLLPLFDTYHPEEGA